MNIFISIQQNAIAVQDALPEEYKRAESIVVENTACPSLNPEEQLLADEDDALEEYLTSITVRVDLRTHLRNARTAQK